MCWMYYRYHKPSKLATVGVTVGQLILVACLAIEIYFMAYYEVLKSAALFTINDYCAICNL